MLRRLLSRLTRAPTSEASALFAPDSQDPFGPDFVQKLEVLALLSRRLFHHRSRLEQARKRRGSGIEFVEHREYLLGDDPRLIDWNATQRLDHLLVRINEEQEDPTTYVLLDASASMVHPFGTQFVLGKQLTAALGYLFLRRFDRVMIGAFRDGTVFGEPPKRGHGRILPHLGFLRQLQAQGTTSLADSMRYFTSRYRRPGTVYLVSDLASPDGFYRATDALRYAKHKVHWVKLWSPLHQRLAVEGDVTLKDCETGEALDMTLNNSLLSSVRREADQTCSKFARYCAEHQSQFYASLPRAGFEEMVMGVLRSAHQDEPIGQHP